MAIYLKKFENHTQYENYINGSGAILPNVSICTTEGDVHYNPYAEPVETRVVAKFNVTDTNNPTRIASGTTSFTAIEIDGFEQSSVTTGYTFDTVGEHTVKYTLTDPTSIGNSAFRSCSGLTSIDIPNSVTSIGSYAFYWCSGLTSCTLGSGITSIGSFTFASCSNLTSIEIPSGVTSIGHYAFEDCSGLTSIDIPNSVTSIGIEAFYYCSGLTSCTIGSSVTSIGERAFGGCSSLPVENSIRYADTYAVEAVDKTLSTYTIKSGTKWIGENAFRNCTGLTSIDIPSGVTSIGYQAFEGCSSLTNIGIPSGVTSIGNNTFAGCSSLTSIEIPSGVARIGNMAFYNCSGLTGITVRRETPPYLVQTCDDDDYCWYDNFNNTNNCPIYVPSASVETYKSTSGWSSYASRIQAIP